MCIHNTGGGAVDSRFLMIRTSGSYRRMTGIMNDSGTRLMLLGGRSEEKGLCLWMDFCVDVWWRRRRDGSSLQENHTAFVSCVYSDNKGLTLSTCCMWSWWSASTMRSTYHFRTLIRSLKKTQNTQNYQSSPFDLRDNSTWLSLWQVQNYGQNGRRNITDESGRQLGRQQSVMKKKKKHLSMWLMLGWGEVRGIKKALLSFNNSHFISQGAPQPFHSCS